LLSAGGSSSFLLPRIFNSETEVEQSREKGRWNERVIKMGRAGEGDKDGKRRRG